VQPFVTMLRQGVLPRHPCANALMQHGAQDILGILRLVVACAPPSLRMTDDMLYFLSRTAKQRTPKAINVVVHLY
jgi:hypothetical protein